MVVHVLHGVERSPVEFEWIHKPIHSNHPANLGPRSAAPGDDRSTVALAENSASAEVLFHLVLELGMLDQKS